MFHNYVCIPLKWVNGVIQKIIPWLALVMLWMDSLFAYTLYWHQMEKILCTIIGQISNAPQASLLIRSHVHEQLTSFTLVWSWWSHGWKMTNPSKESTSFRCCCCVGWSCQLNWLWNWKCICSHFTRVSATGHLWFHVNNRLTANWFCISKRAGDSVK